MGYIEDLLKEPIVEKSSKKKEIEIVDESEENRPIDENIECEECGHQGVHWWLQQTRAGDEPETKFLKCPDCGHTWRDYS